MIIDTLNQQIITAMKAHDEVRTSTLKLLSNEIHNYQIDHKDMTAEDELNIVRKEVKKRKDAIEAYTKANALERSEHENEEMGVLLEFLPPQIEDEELEKIVDEAITQTGAKEIKDMGKVIGIVMAKSKGNADGAKVAALVKQKLT